MARHYLDHASTTPLRPAARAAMVDAIDLPAADPGRLHTEAMEVRVTVERGRAAVADLLGVRPRQVILTASASESIAAAVFGLAARRDGPVVVTAVEHSAVTRAVATHADDRPGPVVLGVDDAGRIDPTELASTLDDLAASGHPAAFVACQLANHEVGAVQPIAEVADLCRAGGVPLLVDAAQAVGRLRLDLATIDADAVAVSGHKLGGPAGTGALVVRRGLRLAPLIVGAAQERDRRAGLENAVGIAGLGAAAAELAATLDLEVDHCARHTDRLRSALGALDGVRVVGPDDPTERLPHLVCAVIDDVEPHAVVLGLDRRGIAVHSGSACAAEDVEPSPVLAAMRLAADRSLRLSVGWSTTDADVDAVLGALPAVLDDLRALRT